MPLAPATITRIIVDWDENSCEARIEYEGDGYTHSAVIADPEAFYDAVKAGIGPWLYEREQARRALPVRFECNPDESGGYDRSNPKHPAFHSTHADIWDSRAGK